MIFWEADGEAVGEELLAVLHPRFRRHALELSLRGRFAAEPRFLEVSELRGQRSVEEDCRAEQEGSEITPSADFESEAKQADEQSNESKGGPRVSAPREWGGEEFA